jgi:hypothetical protein
MNLYTAEFMVDEQTADRRRQADERRRARDARIPPVLAAAKRDWFPRLRARPAAAICPTIE